MDIYLHGVETIEKNDGPRPVQTIDTGVIGMVFTAPDADETLWPLNVCRPVYGLGGFTGGVGETGTGQDAFNGIFAQATRASQTIVAVRIEEGATPAETLANAMGSLIGYTGIHALRKAFSDLRLKPKILIAPGLTSITPTDAIDSVTITDPGGTYRSPPTVSFTLTGSTGSGAEAVAVINSETGELTEIVITNPGSNYDTPPTVVLSDGLDPADGDAAQATATVTVGAVVSPVVSGLLSIANRLRAMVFADGPNTTTSAALDYRFGFDTDRLWIFDPYAKILKDGVVVQVPASAYAAGLQARVDYEEGFWVTASNHVVEGIVGTARTIGHERGDPSSESQLLNKNGVATIIRAAAGGLKLWGSRTASSDPLLAFTSVRRAHDTIIDSIEIASEPFVDKPFSVQNLTDIAETVNGALRRWQGLGATLGGRVWLDPVLNTKETWASGHVYVSYDAEAPAPMEHITFVFNRNTGYYETLAADAIAEIARVSGTSLSIGAA